jgi:hypothetical protein
MTNHSCVPKRTDDGVRALQDVETLLQLCPRCGADRLIPLTFEGPPPDDGGLRDADGQPGVSDPPARPVLKCVACGWQLYARDLAHPLSAST